MICLQLNARRITNCYRIFYGRKKEKGCVYNFFILRTQQMSHSLFLCRHQQMIATSTIAQTSTCVVVKSSSSLLSFVALASWSWNDTAAALLPAITSPSSLDFSLSCSLPSSSCPLPSLD